MDDFASTALLELVATELRRQGVVIEIPTEFEGKTSSGAKASALALAMDQVGPKAVLAIGQGYTRVRFHPVVAVLLRSTSPRDLVRRWIRLEAFYHGNHRVLLHDSERSSQGSLKLEHVSLKGAPPSVGEDLLIAGFLAALMSGAGAVGLKLSIDGNVVIRGDEMTGPDTIPDNSHLWHLSWSEFEPQLRPSFTPTEGEPLSASLTTVLLDDVARGWKIADVATVIGMSSRTVQRRLSEESTTFQKILRKVRAEAAAKFILDENLSLSETGYVSGYADQAHFNREFKRRFNLTPAEFAKVSS